MITPWISYLFFNEVSSFNRKCFWNRMSLLHRNTWIKTENKTKLKNTVQCMWYDEAKSKEKRELKTDKSISLVQVPWRKDRVNNPTIKTRQGRHVPLAEKHSDILMSKFIRNCEKAVNLICYSDLLLEVWTVAKEGLEILKAKADRWINHVEGILWWEVIVAVHACLFDRWRLEWEEEIKFD